MMAVGGAGDTEGPDARNGSRRFAITEQMPYIVKNIIIRLDCSPSLVAVGGAGDTEGPDARHGGDKIYIRL